MPSHSTRKRKSPASKPLPGWIWLFTGLVIGLSATFLPKLNQQKTKAVYSKQDKPEATSSESSTKRKFDFYTLLPELEVVVDGNSSAAVDNSLSQNGTYVLQVGSFKSNNEADTLKARLALMGVETNIEIVTVNDNKWHRVRVGPSQDKLRLQSIQTRLRNEKMDSVLLKVRS